MNILLSFVFIFSSFLTPILETQPKEAVKSNCTAETLYLSTCSIVS